MAIAVKKLKSERFQGHKKWLVGLFLLYLYFLGFFFCGGWGGGAVWLLYAILLVIIHGVITDIVSNSRMKLIILANFIIQIWLS